MKQGIVIALMAKELRYTSEPFGLYIFSWVPRKCRNGKWRWLRWLEQHRDGTYTLGNRAF
jgi:hypothetical protein